MPKKDENSPTHFLVNLRDAWIDVRGKIFGTSLRWYDPRDRSEGVVPSDKFIPFIPRPLSSKERGAS